jgi:hypothetical protein
MEWSEILTDAAAKLDSLGIRHVVVGSCASMVYGEPRFTRDVDLLVDLQRQHILPLLAAFPPPDHYVSQTAIEQALRQQSMFNIIYTQWAIKVDVMIYDKTSRELQEIERGIEIEYAPGKRVRFAAPEDVILKKLEYYQQGGSEKHLRDIAGMLQLNRRPIDRNYISDWARKLGTLAVWELILEKITTGN